VKDAALALHMDRIHLNAHCPGEHHLARRMDRRNNRDRLWFVYATRAKQRI
jgi:hypothetical protein